MLNRRPQIAEAAMEDIVKFDKTRTLGSWTDKTISQKHRTQNPMEEGRWTIECNAWVEAVLHKELQNQYQYQQSPF